MENKLLKNKSNIFWIILVLVSLVFVYNNYQKKNSWTLMVCETKMSNNVECDDLSYEIPGFKSEKECLLEGASKFSKEGFECGKGCKKDGILNICSVICNKAGCN